MEPFKNAFDEAAVRALATRVHGQEPPFPVERFVQQATDGLHALELKARVVQIAAALRACLPGEVPAALQVLVATLGPPFDPEVANGGSFQVWPLTQFVQDFGLDHPDASLDALHAMTQRFTGEFAIRPFLRLHPVRTLERLEGWVHDPSVHVRRLVSEGSRTRLPWGERLQRFIDDPSPTLALVERLRDDPAEYVRRSVANHLNDLAKDHPERVVDIARRWWEERDHNDRQRLVRHALRTLIKQGHPGALGVIGFGAAGRVGLRALRVEPSVSLGGALGVEVELHNPGDQPVDVLLDLVVHHLRAGGGWSPKVFKWTTLTLAAGETRRLQRRHPMKVVTTRRYYPGAHRVEVQVNGEVLGGEGFELLG